MNEPSIQRYRMSSSQMDGAVPIPDTIGGWVKYEDVVDALGAAAAEIDRLRAEVAASQARGFVAGQEDMRERAARMAEAGADKLISGKRPAQVDVHVHGILTGRSAAIRAFPVIATPGASGAERADEPRRWRHKKSGGAYTEVGRASLQLSYGDPVEGAVLVIYRGEDGQLWARAVDEFEDGRFEPIADAGGGA